MNTFRIETRSIIKNLKMDRISKESKNYLKIDVKKIECVPFFHVSFLDGESLDFFKEKSSEIFYDPIMEEASFENTNYDFDELKIKFVISIEFRAGVTDNTAASAKEAWALFDKKTDISSGKLYFIDGDLTKEEAKRVAVELLGNDLIQSIDIYDALQFSKLDRFSDIRIPKVVLDNEQKVEMFDFNTNLDDLETLSIERCLALNRDELKVIQNYYGEKNLTDVELEVIAQTWSEHCKHKIFAANIDYDETGLQDRFKKIGGQRVESLYKKFIKGATKDIEEKRQIKWLISVFSDNAGVVRFDKKVDLCIKAETHNSPSALDPYGGALTGILGVNRDILGVGMGARPIANTDVFCLAPPSWPLAGDEEKMPATLKHPRRILEGVHQGVEDGGNKSGVPTVNGAIYFDQDYAGKPLVFCGTVGVMPQKLKSGTEGSSKNAKVGDRVVMVGGAIGADGIHGATFSSLELNESSPATAVQIGDPLTQKRVTDFLIAARDAELFSCLTDNGAGGLSSSVGEMATLTGGATLDLSLCPVKYPGLTPYELMISESQERMTFAVPEKDISGFMKLAESFGVSASNLGFFNDSGKLEIFYGEKNVANLDLDFLHDGLPQMELKANWMGPKTREHWLGRDDRKPLSSKLDKNFLEQVLVDLLATPNIVSKESWVRRYDHEVQAATHIKPFAGKTGHSPSDSGVIWLAPHGGEEFNAISIGCGLNPRMSLYDPYLMAQYSVDEALRNVVVSGGDVDECCLLDNFCWPDPVASNKNTYGEHKLGQLVRTCAGLYDSCLTFGTPLVSGKDSMKNDFRGKSFSGDELAISILPTLLVTAMARNDIRYTVTSPFKKSGDLIYLLGKRNNKIKISEFSTLYETSKIEEEILDVVDTNYNLETYRKYHQTCKLGLFSSGHDVSDGGISVAVAECVFGNELGAKIKLDDKAFENYLAFLYGETTGQFIVSIPADKKNDFEKIWNEGNSLLIGEVTSENSLEISHLNKVIINLSGKKLLTAFTKEL